MAGLKISTLQSSPFSPAAHIAVSGAVPFNPPRSLSPPSPPAVKTCVLNPGWSIGQQLTFSLIQSHAQLNGPSTARLIRLIVRRLRRGGDKLFLPFTSNRFLSSAKANATDRAAYFLA